MAGRARLRPSAEQAVLPGTAAAEQPGDPGDELPDDDFLDELRAEVIGQLRQGFATRSPYLIAFAEEACRTLPGDPEAHLLAALAAIVSELPTDAQRHLRRCRKLLGEDRRVGLLAALAAITTGNATGAQALLTRHQIGALDQASAAFVGGPELRQWLAFWFQRIGRDARREQLARARAAERAAKAGAPAQRAAGKPPGGATAAPDAAAPESLPRLAARLATRFELVDPGAIVAAHPADDGGWFRLRGELAELQLLQGFDELLCLPTLTGIEAHAYQVETVRRVLRQFRGRVLLADEVGLGKTIEAGMVIKEYLLRGMAQSILILVPAALVGQWREEMAEKFGLDFATTHDPLLRTDPDAFWAGGRIIASIATARRKEHAVRLAGRSFDVVAVDEAHHLREQSSASWRLVNQLQKRFLLLLSATPVQNNLIELYNLLTLLQPGIFRTAKEFRAAYMTPGKPREPANRDRLRDLMRGVMVRNTRAVTALRLPRRHAATLRAQPAEAEAACYDSLGALVRETAVAGRGRLGSLHLLTAAGSSPAAAAAALMRAAERDPDEPRWAALARRYAAIGLGAKETALRQLLARNPAEKKIVFVHHRETLRRLADGLAGDGLRLAVFEGSLPGPEKDAAVAAFRDEVPLLLCSESGGEGRNLQFCNSLINFDIPWNPMAIEQRVGRIDRIGQAREVFVFNLVTAGTIEDRVLAILDDKINMFEMVVGEVGAILGELEEEQDFPGLVLDAWLQASDVDRHSAFAALETRLEQARGQYEDAKRLDEALFGDELDA
jgi:superfamily II DNA or RNA helicase